VPNVRLPIRYSLTPVVDPVAAPAVGQHTEEVIREVLGYDEGQLADLSEAGAFGDQARSRASAKVKS
jgi:crotonobetainyl-CoA:carnitine CoA-transferase CaiB-like acyl-CoA transferase